jgi:CubicO group peptidase (beta-lactamase class C family)
MRYVTGPDAPQLPLRAPITRTLLHVVTLLAVPTVTRAQPSHLVTHRIDSVLRQYAAADAPGVAVAVVRDGVVIYARGHGLADLSRGTPITPNTRFDVGSVAKPFTGMAIATLVHHGRLSLTDTVQHRLATLSSPLPPITIGQLLFHTSGLRDWPGLLRLAGRSFDVPITTEEVHTLLRRQRELNFPPGLAHVYCNSGYVLLGDVVQRITGQTLRQWTDSAIFRPLGMSHTHVHDVPDTSEPRAVSYRRSGTAGWTSVPYDLTVTGSSALQSSISDLARWMVDIDRRWNAAEPIAELWQTRGTLASGDTVPYAFGLEHGQYRGAPTRFHSGQWAGFTSQVIFYPSHRAGIVVLSNAATINPIHAAESVADVVLADVLAPRAPPSSWRASVVLAKNTLDQFTGVYRLGPAWYVRITRRGGALSAQVAGEPAAVLVPTGDNSFWAEAYRAEIAFRRNSVGDQADALRLRNTWAVRVDAEGLTPPASLAPYAGTFFSSELETTYTIAVRDKTLTIESPQAASVRLAHRWGDEFEGAASPFGAVRFTRDSTGRVHELLISSNERNHELRFGRRDAP